MLKNTFLLKKIQIWRAEVGRIGEVGANYLANFPANNPCRPPYFLSPLALARYPPQVAPALT